LQDLRVSVVIVTWLRPEYVRRCLAALGDLQSLPYEVLVVDASEDDRTAGAVADFPWATRVYFAGGAGHMTTARNEGLRHVTGDVVAFLDDDTEVRAGWLRALTKTYADPRVDAVAGRTCNGQPGEDREGVHEIGRLLPDGRLTGNFAANPGKVVTIDHGIGANMSFRAATLAHLGGFRDDFPGTALREDADVFLRITLFGGYAVFAPEVVADHRGAPHIRGRRFDWRYQFWGLHNHALLLSRNLGLRSPVLWSWIREVVATSSRQSTGFVRRIAKLLLTISGLAAGISTSIRKARAGPTDPIRHERLIN
jgi:GT2 family glycosyltransferase